MPKNVKTSFADESARIFATAPALPAIVKLFDKVEDVIACIKDVDSRYLWVNEAFLRGLNNIPREDVVGRTASDLLPAVLAQGYEEQDRRMLTKGDDLHDQIEMIIRPDGNLGWYVTDKVLVKDEAGTVYAIVVVSRDLHVNAEADSRYGRLAAAVERIQTDYAQPLRMSDLANECDLSLSQFERLTRSVLKISPIQLLMRQRIEAAAGLLRTTDKPISLVAKETGFSDQASFCRHFKAKTGVTPSSYRKM